MPVFNIGFVIFPDFDPARFYGTATVLSRLPQSANHIVAKSEAPVPSDCGLGLVPTHTFARAGHGNDIKMYREIRQGRHAAPGF